MTSILKVSEIQDPTNSNTALTIDNSGNVSGTGTFLLDNNHPIFSFSGVSGFQSAGYEGVGPNIVCPSGYRTTIINQAGLMGSDGAMVAPADGIYEFCVVTQFGTTNQYRGLYVYHKSSSGTNQIDTAFAGNNYYGYTTSCHRIVSLSQGDKILWGYHNSYDSWDTNDSNFNCWGRRLK